MIMPERQIVGRQLKTNKGAGAALLCALLLVALPARALEAIDTDGPDFVESSEAVPRGHFQYEIDLTSVRDRRSDPHTTTISTPTLLKYGFADNLEIRIAPEGYVRQNGESGAGDTAFGIKWHSQDRDAALGKPAVSWILHFDTPTGSTQFKGNGVRPSLRTVLTWSLPHELALGLMPGIKYDTREDGQRFTSAIFGAVLNKQFSDRFRGFVEFSGSQIARAADGGVLASWDIGAAYLVNNDIQLGARAGVAANRNTPNSYVLFEWAQRF
jgi:outer membrane putative beta-barrel porin/alpha-amylase